MFGLPDGVTACLFDMDGVVTQTAIVHEAAWKEMFDEFLRARAKSTGTEFVPFDAHADYDEYVDGKPRLDGTRSFLESRGIELPEGKADDPPGTPTIYGLSNRKNDLVLAKLAQGRRSGLRGHRHLHHGGARGGDSDRDRVVEREHQADARGRGAGRPVRRAGGRAWSRTERGLRGKPAPDTFLDAAPMLHLAAARRPCSRTRWPGSRRAGPVTSRSWSGVDRVGQADELREHGADIVVKDLAELLGKERPDDQAVGLRG